MPVTELAGGITVHTFRPPPEDFDPIKADADADSGEVHRTELLIAATSNRSLPSRRARRSTNW